MKQELENREPGGRSRVGLRPAKHAPVAKLLPGQLVIATAVAIFLAEAFVMFVLPQLPAMSTTAHALLDATLLLLLILPALQFFLLRPLRLAARQREQASIEGDRERENLRTVLEAAPVGILLMDDSATVVRINDVAAKLAGKTPSEMLNVQPGEALGCVHASDDPRGCGAGPCCSSCPIRGAIESVLESGESVEGFEAQMILAIDGLQIGLWLEVSAKPVTIAGGKHVIASVSNITGRKRAEKELRESKDKYQLLYDSSADAIMTLTPQEGFLSGNASAIRIFGCRDEEEFIARGPASLSPELQSDGIPSDRKAQEMMAIALKEGSHFFEWRHKRVDETEFDATVLLSRITLDGEVCLLATVRDISQQKEAEREARRLQKQIGYILGATNTGIDIIDSDFNIRYINSQLPICDVAVFDRVGDRRPTADGENFRAIT